MLTSDIFSVAGSIFPPPLSWSLCHLLHRIPCGEKESLGGCGEAILLPSLVVRRVIETRENIILRTYLLLLRKSTLTTGDRSASNSRPVFKGWSSMAINQISKTTIVGAWRCGCERISNIKMLAWLSQPMKEEFKATVHYLGTTSYAMAEPKFYLRSGKKFFLVQVVADKEQKRQSREHYQTASMPTSCFF
ncbi:hypothetical protein MRB53_013365 [Persea americana]|uniref:Uncharacterized protein n=1 Tax=Persea americana TaxID=3435 RepID=A0ACC2K7U1_PERAE|nr:hypothetical protein MRB53_013365 [Persea americana]